MDLDEIARAQGVEAAQDIAIGLAIDVPPEPALKFIVADPEGVEPEDFDVRIMFRNEYFAKVFAKRALTAIGLPFDADSRRPGSTVLAASLRSGRVRWDVRSGRVLLGVRAKL